MANKSRAEDYFEIGMIIGVSIGLFDALRAVTAVGGANSKVMTALLFSVSALAIGGGLASTAIFWLLEKLNLRDSRFELTWKRFGFDLVRSAAAILGISLVGYLVARVVSRLLSHGSHVLVTILAFLVSGIVVAVFVRWTRPLAVRRPLGFAAGLAVVCGIGVAGIMLSSSTRSVATKIDTATSPPRLAAMGIQYGYSETDSTGEPTFAVDARSTAEDPERAGVPAGLPNVLFIVMDTVRADHLSLYGYPRETTPFLSEFARAAAVYEHAISPAPWTLPSHATMFTGQLPSVHRATTEHRLLRPEFVTIAEILAHRGYATAGFSSNSVVGSIHNLDQGFDDFYEVWRITKREPGPLHELLAFRQLASALEADRGWRDKGARETGKLVRYWLDKQKQEAPKKPYFVFINYLEAHLPYDPPTVQRRQFLDEALLPSVDKLCSEHWLNEAFKLMGLKGSLSTDDYRQLAALYDGEIAYLDECIRDLLSDLEAHGDLDNTCVIITSDHGENIGEHGGLLDHCLSINQTLLRVPLLIKYPSSSGSGFRCSDLVTTTSIFAEILGVTGSAAALDWPPAAGRLPITNDDPAARFVVSEYGLPVWELSLLASEVNGVDIRPYAVRLRSVQNDSWKLVQRSEGPPVLYDLTRDPGENSPLDPARVPAGAELQEYLDGWLATLHPIDLPPPHLVVRMDDETRKSLRSLGYVH